MPLRGHALPRRAGSPREVLRRRANPVSSLQVLRERTANRRELFRGQHGHHGRSSFVEVGLIAIEVRAAAAVWPIML